MDHTSFRIFYEKTMPALRAYAMRSSGSVDFADDIVQGEAGGDEFRTAPLWGLGQRLFFLHDGRTNDLVEAIHAHASPASGHARASEANTVVERFRALSETKKQDVLNFLRSL